MTIDDAAKRLRELAEKATPGPWDAFMSSRFTSGGIGVENSDEEAIFWGEPGGLACARREDAFFIAAANPAVILELLDALEKAQARAEKAEADLQTRIAYDVAESMKQQALVIEWRTKAQSAEARIDKALALASGDNLKYDGGTLGARMRRVLTEESEPNEESKR